MTYFYVYLVLVYGLMSFLVLTNLKSFKNTFSKVERVIVFAFSPILLPAAAIKVLYDKVK